MADTRPSLSQSDLPDEIAFGRWLRQASWGIALGFGLPAAALLGAVLYLLHSARQVEAADQYIAEAQEVAALMVDLETGLRGYQATESDIFLEPYHAAASQLDGKLDQLAASGTRGEMHAQAVAALRWDIARWREFAGEALAAGRKGASGRELDFHLRGKALMDDVRGRINAIVSAGHRQHARESRALERIRWGLISGLILLGLLGAPAAAVWIRRLLHKIAASYEGGASLARRRAEEWHVTLRSIGDAVVATDAEGCVAFLNPVAEQLMGWTTAEAQGLPLKDVFVIFNEQTGAPAENPVARVLRERIVVGLANHTVIRSRHGTETPIEDSAAPILDDAGHLLGVILVFRDVGDKRESERRLLEAEWRSRTALEVGGAGSWVWEVEKDRVTGDAMLARTFGVPLETCRAGTKVAAFLAAIHEEDRPRVEATIRRAVENASRYEADFSVRDENGTSRWVQARGRVIPREGGESTKLLGFLIDATMARRAEESLKESEGRFRFLNSVGEATRQESDPGQIMATVARLLGEHLAASRCAYAEVEADGVTFHILHDYTQDCESTVGTYRLSLFGSRAMSEMQSGTTLVVHDVDAELPDDEGASMFKAIGIRAIICCPLIRDGSLRAMMAMHQTVPRRWTPAEVALVEEMVERSWATIERARAEAAVRAAVERAEANARAVAESSERFRLLSEVVALQVWTAAPDGGLDFANQECTKYFGTTDSTQEVLGHAWVQFVHPDDLPVAQERWAKSLQSGERYEMEFRLRRHDGDYRWYLVRAQAERAADGNVVRWFGTNTEIHDLKLAQAGAERASRAKDDFLAALSHELRTPLTPVLMTAAALRGDTSLPAAVREQLGMMERNIALEARLIDDLLDLTRIARGKLDVRRKPCDAHSLIGLAIEIVRDESMVKGIRIQRDFAAECSGLTVDPARFQQVIWNLLRNAVKFTPRGGDVTIKTWNEVDASGGQCLRIEVRDSGIGIPAPQLETIFLPFEQGGLTGDHRFGGVGLGLAIARAIVDLHGGTIQALSEGADRGATFVVEFPEAIDAPDGAMDPPVSASAIPSPEVPSDQGRPPLRLLLVEDHEPTLQVMQRLLKRAGHEVVPARSLAEALAAAASHSFDLVISDLGLPDGTGTDLMRELRDTHGLRGIALSGYGMDEDIVRAREAGFVSHLTKPVDFQQLERALREIL